MCALSQSLATVACQRTDVGCSGLNTARSNLQWTPTAGAQTTQLYERALTSVSALAHSGRSRHAARPAPQLTRARGLGGWRMYGENLDLQQQQIEVPST